MTNQKNPWKTISDKLVYDNAWINLPMLAQQTIKLVSLKLKLIQTPLE
ncbi:MAG: hypothetical protein RL262_1691 [Bacteroidota bacterium]